METLWSIPGQDIVLNADNGIGQILSHYNISETPLIGIYYNFVK